MLGIFKRNTQEAKHDDACSLVRGMIYASEKDSYNYGYELGMGTGNAISEMYEGMTKNSEFSNTSSTETLCHLCSISTSSRLLYGTSQMSGPNLIIPRSSIDPKLAKELEKVSITDGLIDGIADFIDHYDAKIDKRKEVNYFELREALIDCGVTEPDKAIDAMIKSGNIFEVIDKCTF